MQDEGSFDVSIKNTKNTQKEGQKGHFKPFFLNPGSPRLASGLPGPPNSLGVK